MMSKPCLSGSPIAVALTVALVAVGARAGAGPDIRGNVSAQWRVFTEDAAGAGQKDSYLSVNAEPEFFWESESRKDSFLFVPFVRLDQHDDERTHADVREASWIHLGEDYEWRVGVRRVFWGKTEFQHLVDVINQFDAVEDIDNEDKLGQPMVNLSLVRNWGILDFYILPYFRERTFAGEDGRPHLPLPVDTDNARYQSSDEEKHIDYAIRWAHYVDIFDFGVSWFQGTNRDPLLLPGVSAAGEPVLTPYYEQMRQISFDGQATVDSWLWKLEALYRDTDSGDYWASQAGFEYTFYGVMNSVADVGVLLEYGWDERGEDAVAVNQNDVFAGGRLTFNDAESSEVLFGVGQDLDYDSRSLLIEASRRFGDRIKVSLDARLFSSRDADDPVYAYRRDDFLQLTLEYYF